MNAAVLTAYGSPGEFEVQALSDPTPGPGEIRVRVAASTVTAGDGELRRLDMPWLFMVPLRLWLGWSRPRPGTVLGMEVAGVVDAVGEGVARFAVGERVVGATGMTFGGNATSALLSVHELVAPVPDEVPWDEVAPLPIGGLAALGYLQLGGLRDGQRVLVRGASGSIGSYAVQLAKAAGASVVGVCGPNGLAAVADLGADEAVDYTVDDIFDRGQSFDLVLDVVGGVSIGKGLRLVRPGGTYVRATVPGLWDVMGAVWARLFGPSRVVLGDAGGSSGDLAGLVGRVADGSLRTLVHARFPLERIEDAHASNDAGDKVGHILVM